MAEPQKTGVIARIIIGLCATLATAYVLAFLADRTGYSSEAFIEKALPTLTEQYHRSKGD